MTMMHARHGGEQAVLDAAHVGDIRGALGSIAADDTGARRGLSAKLKTLLAIVGPGLIVMVGDNDAGSTLTDCLQRSPAGNLAGGTAARMTGFESRAGPVQRVNARCRRAG